MCYKVDNGIYVKKQVFGNMISTLILLDKSLM